MANLPISPVIVEADASVEGPTSGVNGGSSDSVIGIATDVINPSLSSYARVEVGARRSPIGLPQPALGAAAYLVDYENNSFDRSPVIFAEGDYDANVGEVFADTLNFSVTNESHEFIEVGEWLWGVAVPQSDIYYTTGDDVLVSEFDWETNGVGVVTQDTNEYIRFSPNPGKVECWNQRFSPEAGYPTPQVNGARYRVEITIGDNTAGNLVALVKRPDNSNTAPTPFPLSANTLGADQAFEYVSDGSQRQINVGTLLTSGFVQVGKLEIFGPLAT